MEKITKLNHILLELYQIAINLLREIEYTAFQLLPEIYFNIMIWYQNKTVKKADYTVLPRTWPAAPPRRLVKYETWRVRVKRCNYEETQSAAAGRRQSDVD